MRPGIYGLLDDQHLGLIHIQELPGTLRSGTHQSLRDPTDVQVTDLALRAESASKTAMPILRVPG